jgi:hypothetical protein
MKARTCVKTSQPNVRQAECGHRAYFQVCLLLGDKPPFRAGCRIARNTAFMLPHVNNQHPSIPIQLSSCQLFIA